ncbi:hypothetical protein TPR58_21560 [Sphingomonas sp. HF-S3]|uniref:J domain-containing protein n=1 Tax=Sphingomonas rustica TaxID=3103142 RepID=A0ABV0BDZ8_9SPHN
MNDARIWATLGIEPTEDARAIRTAYSRQLKAIDADADAQAFIALREARDIALRLATSVEIAGESDAELDAPLPPSESQAEDVSLGLHASGPQWAPEDLADARGRELSALLHSERDPENPWPTEAERRHMLDLWTAIIHDPRLEEVGFYGAFEAWAINQIAYTTPVSDPLVIPATEMFGWTASDGTVHQSREVGHITYRYGLLKFLEDVREPDHSHHGAWVELNTPAPPGSKRNSVGPRRIRELISVIRFIRPDIERGFDPGRVALWDAKEEFEASDEPTEQRSTFIDSTSGILSVGTLVVWAVLIAIRLPGCLPVSEPTPKPPVYEPARSTTLPRYLVLPPDESGKSVVVPLPAQTSSPWVSAPKREEPREFTPEQLEAIERAYRNQSTP